MRKKKRARPATFECPQCGAVVKVGAAACRECGSDARTGWQSSEEIDYQSIEVPDGWGPEQEPAVPARRSPWTVVVVLVLVVAFALWVVLR